MFDIRFLNYFLVLSRFNIFSVWNELWFIRFGTNPQATVFPRSGKIRSLFWEKFQFWVLIIWARSHAEHRNRCRCVHFIRCVGAIRMRFGSARLQSRPGKYRIMVRSGNKVWIWPLPGQLIDRTYEGQGCKPLRCSDTDETISHCVLSQRVGLCDKDTRPKQFNPIRALQFIQSINCLKLDSKLQ